MPAGASKPKEGVQVSMRHTKISAADAALLAGELNKPSWESRNEGIHERVSFEDSIWGFDLAGGAYYKTPLRVTAVKTDSRADKAGIRPGDKLLRINDIDTSTLTIQEAHEIIIESGIHLRIAVTAPDDLEDSYHCWEDPLDTGYDSEEERRLQKEKEAKRVVHAKVSSYWSLQWPWVSKRRVIYRESNCFMVPSKYEDQHREKFPVQGFSPKVPEDIVLHSKDSEKNNVEGTLATQSPIDPKTGPVPNGVQDNNDIPTNGTIDVPTKSQKSSASETKTQLKEEPIKTEEIVQNGVHDEETNENSDDSIIETEKPSTQEEKNEDETPLSVKDKVDQIKEDPNESDVSQSDVSVIDDDVIEDILSKPEDLATGEEDNIFNEILSDGEKPNDEVKR